MPDRRLQVFHTVARFLSFTKAAETLHMTQPAVTFQVRQLEEYFNTRLFDRTHNRINLTDAGKKVYEYSEKIFELYYEMENCVKELTGEVSGILIIGASTTIAEYMLPALLGDFKANHSDVAIRLKVGNSDDIVSMVETNIIDLGVVESPVHNKNLAVELWCLDQLVAIVPLKHALAHEESIPVHKLVEYPYICREEGSGTREVINEYLHTAGLNPRNLNIVMELGNPEAIKRAVEAGMGISVISKASISKEVQLKTLVGIKLEPILERPFYFVHQKQKFRVRAMEELLRFTMAYGEKHPRVE